MRNRTPWMAFFVAAPTLLGAQGSPVKGQVEALIYTTMPCRTADRPERAMDGRADTAFRSYYGMEEGDTFTVEFSTPVAVRSIRVTTGNADGDDLLSDAVLEGITGGQNYTKLATFGKDGVAAASAPGTLTGLRIRMNKGKSVSHLTIREITVDAPVNFARVQMGPGRGFVDLAGNEDLRVWAEKAERQMEDFWPDATALLYSDGFITPNAVNVIYNSGPDGPPGATGGGVMTVNPKWCREHPDDTGLTVHEMAHVVQSGGAPGWLIEAVADYIRWIKFEPQNHHPRIDVSKATPHDPYRTGATFLGWCELHYDRKLVTKFNDDARFGRYKDSLFVKYCGKDIDTLWKEFIADYKKDPSTLLTAPVPAAMQPRALPTVQSSVSIALPLDTIGVAADGATFPTNAGFDAGGAAFSGKLLGARQRLANVDFTLGAGTKNTLVAKGNVVALTGNHHSLWLLGAAIEGAQRDQVVLVAYTDGSTQSFAQNFSDWYQPEAFPGESRGVRMPYRNMADGSRDPRTFHVYTYGFTLDATKTLKSVTLPNNENIRILAASVGD